MSEPPPPSPARSPWARLSPGADLKEWLAGSAALARELCDGPGCACTPNPDGWCQLAPDPAGALLESPTTIWSSVLVHDVNEVKLVIGS